MPQENFDDEPLTEQEKEDLEFAAEKSSGYYQPPVDAEEPGETMRRGGLAIGAVYMLVGSIVSCVVAGYFLDRFLETAPWFIVSGVILGTIVGFYQFVRISSRKG